MNDRANDRAYQSLTERAAQFTLFSGVGAVGTLGHYAVLVLLVEYGRAGAVFSSMCGFVVGAATNYMLNYYFTFRSKRPHRDAAPRFALIALIGVGLNTAVMGLLANGLELHYLLAQICATVLILVWNFSANRAWTFKENNNASKRIR